MIVLGMMAFVCLGQGILASCPAGQFGYQCEYFCHCGTSCDRITGACYPSTACDDGWFKGNYRCQKENIALRKTTGTTSGIRPDGWLAGGAVDGNNMDLDNQATCFHALNAPSDWTVDLGRVYQLYDIRIYIRAGYGFRIADSFIYVDNNPSQRCYIFPSDARDIPNPTDVTCNINARYVTIRNPGNSRDNDVLNICEVEIYVCSPGTYGINCSSFCHCSDCDRLTGICSGDCRPGWQEERCDIECIDAYGINCNKTCSDRKCSNDSAPCDHFTGSCEINCLPGWTEDDCTQRCDNLHYGRNCSSVCGQRHCSGNSSCHHVTGSCNEECVAGWRGQDCQQKCDNTTYGVNCVLKCADRKCVDNTVSCDRFNGSCDTVCRVGFTGVACTNESVTGLYGTNCSKRCTERHCSGESLCVQETGSCDLGCQSGWMGPDCQEECSNLHYGANCLKKCAERQCLRLSNSTCDHVNGTCEHGCELLWEGTDCIVSSKSSAPSPGAISTPVIAGAAAAIIVLLIVAIIISIIVIRRKRVGNNKEVSNSPETETQRVTYHRDRANFYENFGFNEEMKRSELQRASGEKPTLSARGSDSRKSDTNEERKEEEELEEDEVEEEVKEKREAEEEADGAEVSYYNLDTTRNSHVIPVSDLENRVRELEKRPMTSEEEFKSLPDGFFHPYDESQKPGNKKKNRFRGYYPYNYNRVVLTDDHSGGDYINASYVDGYTSTKRYIAAQGPCKPELIEDVWRMIWQEGCAVVVMVTGLMEGGKMKCLCYWPEEGNLTYGDVMVTKETEIKLAEFTIRKLAVKNEKENKKRHVTHFHFTSWPDHGVPDTSGLLTFMRRVQKTCGDQTVAIVVHCSAGIGRTGTYIAVESLISQAKAEGAVDVVSFVSNMRSQRKNMIQTKEQYLFIYQAVAEAVVEGDTSLDADVIRQMDLDQLSEISMGNKTVQQHLETLQTYAGETLPADCICIPSHRQQKGFLIMTSHPDLEQGWDQIHNSGSRTLITWAGDNESYLPSTDKSEVTTRLTLTRMTSSVISDHVKLHIIEMNMKEDQYKTNVHCYHVTGSVLDARVSVMIDSLLQWTNQSDCGSVTIISDSVSESRLLVLLVNITSRLQDDGKVDVISNMRRLQSLLGGPLFTEDDIRLCLGYTKRRLESQELYANL